MQQSADKQQLSMMQIWLLAARPKTLPAGIVPVVVGGVMAYGIGKFALLPFIAALFGSIMIQIGTNFANDLFDFKKETDRADRIGPMRVTQAGLVTTKQITIATIIAFGLATLAGIYLVYVAGWPIVVIGLISIGCGVLYTAGPVALGYIGLADIFVLVFYGPVALAGTFYVQTLEMSSEIILAGLPFGMISTAILVVNNLRDIETDRKSNKKSMAVRFGATFARMEYLLLLIGAAGMPVFLYFQNQANLEVMLASLFILFAIPSIRTVFSTTDGERLNNCLASTGRLLIVYGLLFSVGYLL